MKDCHAQVNSYEGTEVRMTSDERKDIYKKATTNRDRVKLGLEANKDPKPLGFRTQGSYAMRTMIRYRNGDYDIDDGVYFDILSLRDENGADKTPSDARQMVREAASDNRFNKSPQARDNCVRVYYNEGYHLDVPVYREIKDSDPTTGTVTVRYELASKDEWRRSDPLKVTKWIKDNNSSKCSDATATCSDGQLVRTVRLLKAFARSRQIWCGSTTTGFAIAKLVVDLFGEDKSRDDRLLKSIGNAVVARLKLSEVIKHPILDENVVEHGDERVKFFRECLEVNLPHLDVLDKNDCSHADAMAAWDKFFNTDWFSKQPDPDDEDKLEKALSAPIIKGGDARYARPRDRG